MNKIFLTASGTGIGKTFVTRVLIHQLRARGRAVRALKPIATGFGTDGDEPSDTELLQQRCCSALQHGVRVGAIDAADVVELGRVTSGQHPGRETAEQITVSDLTGTGVQDTAIALATYAAAVAKGCGTTV